MLLVLLAGQKCPLAHGPEHCAEPSPCEAPYVPAGQDSGSAAPVTQKWPSGQGRHSSSDARLVALPKAPASQGSGTEEPGSQYDPAGQTAQSRWQAMMAEAKGEAATIVEQGRSQAEGLQDLVESLKRSGNDAKRLFLLQKLEPLLTMLSETVQPVEVEEVTLIGEREGQNNLALGTLLRQLQESTGIQLLRQPDGSAASDQPTDSAQ